LEGVEAWIKEALEVKQGNPKLSLIGNKIDLADQRQVSSDEGKALADKYEADYFEVSALTGENVTNAFTCVGRKLLDSRDDAKKDVRDVVSTETNHVNLHHDPPNANTQVKKASCCR